ncbi:unnamed protein product [Aspergillus oryzae RIB40]|uniref:DNA, SC005 n=1 Tax=Aspergillus oryzae (strain ATCC 42149 / RIB 40) TaxID=510516 RepID=Q2UR16_ASPOR|nr:unnamed protein product [Aspergillus oryzae RIB40]BAE55999.1 unnamed protein product [Aspergillus oryzae RIB40]
MENRASDWFPIPSKPLDMGPKFDCEPDKIKETAKTYGWGSRAREVERDSDEYKQCIEKAGKVAIILKRLSDQRITVDVSQYRLVCIFLDIKQSELHDILSCITACKDELVRHMFNAKKGPIMTLPLPGDQLEEGHERMCFGFKTIKHDSNSIYVELAYHLERFILKIFPNYIDNGDERNITLPFMIENHFLAVLTTPDIRDDFALRRRRNPLGLEAKRAYHIPCKEARFADPVSKSVLKGLSSEPDVGN